LPCGSPLRICGPTGCIEGGVREDSCPQCWGDWVDLSTAGIAAVCGPEVSSCNVSVEVR
jgi:hypothetical protein